MAPPLHIVNNNTTSSWQEDIVKDIGHGLSVFHQEIIVAHPYLCSAVLLVLSYRPDLPFKIVFLPLKIIFSIPKAIVLGFLRCLGFGRDGVGKGTAASQYQSYHYGGYTPAGGLFARSQAYGAIYDIDFPAGIRDDESSEAGTGQNAFWSAIGYIEFFAAIVIFVKYGLGA